MIAQCVLAPCLQSFIDSMFNLSRCQFKFANYVGNAANVTELLQHQKRIVQKLIGYFLRAHVESVHVPAVAAIDPNEVVIIDDDSDANDDTIAEVSDESAHAAEEITAALDNNIKGEDDHAVIDPEVPKDEDAEDEEDEEDEEDCAAGVDDQKGEMKSKDAGVKVEDESNNKDEIKKETKVAAKMKQPAAAKQ